MPSKKTARKKARPSRKKTRARSTKKNIGCPIVGIGGSAGGFEATMELLKALPAENGMTFVIVQHLDPHHASRLPSLLGKATQMPVIEIGGRIKPEANKVYVLPPNKGLIYENGALNLIKLGVRPTLAIDHFFESLAEDQGSRAIGVLLSGSGSDGTAGLRAIKAAGGITFAQDEESAKFPAMPRSAILAGFVDAALSQQQIATELRRITEHPYIRTAPYAAADPYADQVNLLD